MKLHIMSLLIAAATIVSCGTTKNSTSESAAYGLPTPVRLDFERHYPDATGVTWTTYDATTVPIDWELTDWSPLDNNAYTVSFNMGNDKYYAWYDGKGNWIGSTYALDNSSILPSAITATLNSKYSGYTIESLQKEMWKSQTAYEVRLKNGDTHTKLLIDTNGNILKQKDK